MFRIRTPLARLASSMLLATAAALPVTALAARPSPSEAGAPPDQNLLAQYSFDNAYSNVYFSVCGSLPGSSGCYGGGTLGPFGHAGALIEGDEVTSMNGTVVKRNIYVLDDKAGGTGVKLYTYERTDNINGASDSVSVSLLGATTIPLIGGDNVRSYMAADTNYLFIGTSLSQSAQRIGKFDDTVQALGGFSGSEPLYVSAITTSKSGAVIVTYSDNSGKSTGFYAYDADGNFSGDGGGADYLVNTASALTTSSLLTATNAAVSARTVPAIQRKVVFDKVEAKRPAGQ